MGVYLRNDIKMVIPLYRIQYILKVLIDRFKHIGIDHEKNLISSSTLSDDIALSIDGRNKQLANQLIYESIAQFTTGREQEDSLLAEDISYELLVEDGRRRFDGSPSEDSRRR
jgi:hypothetical protein